MKILFHFLILLIALPAAAQDLADTVSIKRGVFTTGVYQRGEKLTYGELWGLYHAYPEASRPLKWSKPLKIASPVVAAGGVVLGAIALKGKPHTAEINGRLYDYKTRSKPQLLTGIAMLVGGICLFEFSNDLVARSARKYNHARITRGKQALLAPENMQVGITPDGGVGIMWKL